ncbi:hypothetical protein ERJ75_001846300 [Trypanosoma vivax]|nr:hypothetical protein ERJ75_001846300 [Trypanosoma vivax]
MRREGNCGAFRLELGREVDDDLETVTAGADSLGLTPCGDVCRNADFGLSMRKSRLAVLVAETRRQCSQRTQGAAKTPQRRKSDARRARDVNSIVFEESAQERERAGDNSSCACERKRFFELRPTTCLWQLGVPGEVAR